MISVTTTDQWAEEVARASDTYWLFKHSST